MTARSREKHTSLPVRAKAWTTLVGRIAEPEEMAATICTIADPMIFGFTTGQVFPCNGGMYMAQR